MQDPLTFILKAQKEICMLESLTFLLDWDEQTNMPRGAIIGRSEQMKYVNGLIHDKLASPEMAQALSSFDPNTISERDAIVIDELQKRVRRSKIIPKKFQSELSETTILSQGVWKEARKANDFQKFLPYLEKIIIMKRQQAAYFNPKVRPYDALLNEYEEGTTMATLDPLFSSLKMEIGTILKSIQGSPGYRSPHTMALDIPKKVQKAIINEFMAWMRLSQDKVQISVSMHPFTAGIAPSDVRITTRYTDTLESFFTAIHEGGHALYRLGLPMKYANTFLYNQSSYAIDESQALFWEYHVAKSWEFWEGYWKRFQEQTGSAAKKEDFFREINAVRPSYIRVNADEVTYPLHIILRYEVEKRLIDGDLQVKDARIYWNTKMKELLGLTPRNDNEGILQDIHWATGDFGYFPTYALGNIYAAMIASQVRKEVKDYSLLVSQQSFGPIIDWLTHRIYNKGKTMRPEVLIKRICGKELDQATYIAYLKHKYSTAYGLT